MYKEKKVKVTISLSEGVLLSIDKHARIQGMSRSAYITKLEINENVRTKDYLKRYENPDYYLDMPVSPNSMLYEE